MVIKILKQAIDNVPLFSIVNGFLINKTGSFEVVIEYKPQAWFYTGLTISIIALILLAITVLIYHNKKTKSQIQDMLKCLSSNYYLFSLLQINNNCSVSGNSI